MLVISLITLIEESAAEGSKHLVGNVKSFDELFKPANLAALEKTYKYFAFLAFHPKTDKAILEYVKSGALSSDSGPNILTLFTLDADATWPIPLTNQSFTSWLGIDASIHPAYQMIRLLFEPNEVPSLPGIVFFQSFNSKRDALYIPLQGLDDVKALQERLRVLFSLADNIVRKAKKQEDIKDELSIALQERRITFSKTSRTTMREWVIRSYQSLGDHMGDIVSVIGLLR